MRVGLSGGDPLWWSLFNGMHALARTLWQFCAFRFWLGIGTVRQYLGRRQDCFAMVSTPGAGTQRWVSSMAGRWSVRWIAPPLLVFLDPQLATDGRRRSSSPAFSAPCWLSRGSPSTGIRKITPSAEPGGARLHPGGHAAGVVDAACESDATSHAPDVRALCWRGCWPDRCFSFIYTGCCPNISIASAGSACSPSDLLAWMPFLFGMRGQRRGRCGGGGADSPRRH